MSKAKTTKKAFVTSIITLIVFLGVFVTSTYAWFYSTSSSDGTSIVAGNLKVELYSDGENLASSAAPVFLSDASVWEPDFAEGHVIQIRNVGSLNAQYTLSFISADDANGLSEVIDVYLLRLEDNLSSCPSYNETDYPLSSLTKVGTLSDVINDVALLTPADNRLLPAENTTFVILLKMQSNAGVEYEKTTGNYEFTVIAKNYVAQ